MSDMSFDRPDIDRFTRCLTDRVHNIPISYFRLPLSTTISHSYITVNNWSWRPREGLEDSADNFRQHYASCSTHAQAAS